MRRAPTAHCSGRFFCERDGFICQLSMKLVTYGMVMWASLNAAGTQPEPPRRGHFSGHPQHTITQSCCWQSPDTPRRGGSDNYSVIRILGALLRFSGTPPPIRPMITHRWVQNLGSILPTGGCTPSSVEVCVLVLCLYCCKLMNIIIFTFLFYVAFNVYIILLLIFYSGEAHPRRCDPNEHLGGVLRPLGTPPPIWPMITHRWVQNPGSTLLTGGVASGEVRPAAVCTPDCHSLFIA